MRRGMFLLLVGCGGDDATDDTGGPSNACTYEVGSCPDAYCPPAEEDYTTFCVDTSLDSCEGIGEGTTSTFSPYASTSFVSYTRNVELHPDTSCAELSTY